MLPLQPLQRSFDDPSRRSRLRYRRALAEQFVVLRSVDLGTTTM
jgi:hypothetical protein